MGCRRCVFTSLRPNKAYPRRNFALAEMYRYGESGTPDYREAGRWYRRAAEKGLPEAQFNLGVLYDNGQGAPQDYKEAVHWYRITAEPGMADAECNLGLMYANGKGVVRITRKLHAGTAWLQSRVTKKPLAIWV